MGCQVKDRALSLTGRIYERKGIVNLTWNIHGSQDLRGEPFRARAMGRRLELAFKVPVWISCRGGEGIT